DKDDLSKKKSRQEPKQIYVPVVENANTEIVDLEVSSPKEGNIDTSNIVTSPMPKSSTMFLDNVDKVTSPNKGESSGDREMKMQVGSDPVAISSNQVVAVEDSIIEDSTRVEVPVQVEDELAKKSSDIASRSPILVRYEFF
ncbi:hypothetical protein L195_g023709, partial [Trifolium pratense]